MVGPVLLITAPGQGAQTPGFLAPWLEVPGVADRLGAWSDIVGLDLIRCGTTADADEIKDTAVAQPLLVAAALVTFQALGLRPDAVAGHSVGELAAAAMAGVLTEEEAMRLVAVRGRGMAEAAAVTQTGMTAVLGGDVDEVLAAIAKQGLTPANINGNGQIVAAGTLEQLAAFAEEPPAKARLRPLAVAGAFHTEHMAPAVAALDAAAASVTPKDPEITLVSNRDGAVVESGADFLARLVGQVSSPVRWDLCTRTFADLGVTALIELAPGGTLVGLARRDLKGVALLGLKTPEDIEKARELA
ncbi:[acyl-carrier-protein] S-malonyltransferase [Actinocorallia herbida]|uniref:[acyl-carrier-protein] S-malonyltransferase n=1 Tax=Actinocorallia herbida TaxID=58109 RepID=A0A3N1D792_9ACTN|nr:[acyl-carrier-protein] S-malonyltransferase [Actinocorallia herbida]